MAYVEKFSLVGSAQQSFADAAAVPSQGSAPALSSKCILVSVALALPLWGVIGVTVSLASRLLA